MDIVMTLLPGKSTFQDMTVEINLVKLTTEVDGETFTVVQMLPYIDHALERPDSVESALMSGVNRLKERVARRAGTATQA